MRRMHRIDWRSAAPLMPDSRQRSSVGLLQTNPNPSRAEIVQFLQGNVCRCGTHPRIIDAVQQAAKMIEEHGR